MADHNLPTLTSTYTNFVSELDGRLDDIARLLASDTVTATNLPTGAIRWSAASNTFQKWSGTAWAALTTAYSININGTVGATTAASGAFTTLSTSSAASLAAGSTVGGSAIVTTTGTQTLTNKTLTSPVISSISNTGTLTLPTSTDTLVGRATSDTLTNKTLTAPRFADLGFIADAAGEEILQFDSTASAVNHIRITNSAAGGALSISTIGTDTNITLNLISKGTGTVQANGSTIANATNTLTFTNKTWNGTVISNTYGGTGSNSSFNEGGIAYGSTTAILLTTAAGTAGQLLQSNGTSAPTWVNANTLAVSSASTFTSTTQNSQFNSIGVGTTASGTAGEIRATNNITAYYASDIRLKENIRIIPDALDKVLHINGKLFDWTNEYINNQGGVDSYFLRKSDFGVIAQDVEKVFPVAVRYRKNGYLAVDYEKLSALAFAAIKELNEKVEKLKAIIYDTK